MDLNAEQIRLVLEMERKMDAGEVSFIYAEGCTQRCAMDSALMAELGLCSGQTISTVIWTSILRLKVKRLEDEIAYRALLTSQGLLDTTEQG